MFLCEPCQGHWAYVCRRSRPFCLVTWVILAELFARLPFCFGSSFFFCLTSLCTCFCLYSIFGLCSEVSCFVFWILVDECIHTVFIILSYFAQFPFWNLAHINCLVLSVATWRVHGPGSEFSPHYHGGSEFFLAVAHHRCCSHHAVSLHCDAQPAFLSGHFHLTIVQWFIAWSWEKKWTEEDHSLFANQRTIQIHVNLFTLTFLRLVLKLILIWRLSLSSTLLRWACRMVGLHLQLCAWRQTLAVTEFSLFK